VTYGAIALRQFPNQIGGRLGRGLVCQSLRFAVFAGVIRLAKSGDSGSPVLNSEGELVGLILATEPKEHQFSIGMDACEVSKFISITLIAVVNKERKR
jgi:hypothetical protein